MSTPRKPAASTAAKPAVKTVAKAPAKTSVAKVAPKRAVVAAPKAARPASSTAAKPAATAKPVINTEKRYKLLTGIDDSAFCQKVSDHLDAGYELHGSPTMTTKGSQVFVGQAVVRSAKTTKKKKSKKK